MNEPVLLTRGDAILRLTINRPAQRNALSPEIVEAIIAALTIVETEKPLGLIVEGAGPVFCAGLNLSEIESATDGDMLWRLVRIEMMLQKLWSLPCRTICIAQKAAIGAGADILMACQTRVLTPNGRLAFPGLGFGIFLGTNRLSQRIGANAAEQALTAGGPIIAQEAKTLGLVHQIADVDAFETCITDWAQGVRTVDPHVAANLGVTTTRADHAADMDALIHSAARPGLRDRILAFASAQKRARAPKPLKEESEQ